MTFTDDIIPWDPGLAPSAYQVLGWCMEHLGKWCVIDVEEGPLPRPSVWEMLMYLGCWGEERPYVTLWLDVAENSTIFVCVTKDVSEPPALDRYHAWENWRARAKQYLAEWVNKESKWP